MGVVILACEKTKTPMPLRLLPIVALLAATLPSAHADCRLAVASRLPFTVSNSGHLLVPVTLNSQKAELIFDTGAGTSVLRTETVDRIGIQRMTGQNVEGWMGQVGGVGGTKFASAVTAKTVDIGGLIGKNYNFLAGDIVIPAGGGLLSVDLISQYDVDLDFPENQIILYRSIGDCSAPAAFLSSPLYSAPLLPPGSDRRPKLIVFIGGKEVQAMIDTGAPHTAIFRRAAERIGLNLASLTTDPQGSVGGVGSGKVKAVRHIIEPVTIGDLEFENMKVDIIDAHADEGAEMLLGGDFQRAVHLWISYSSGTLIMQYPPRPSKKAPAN